MPIFGHPHAPHSYIYFWRGFDGGAIERKYAGLHMQMNESPALCFLFIGTQRNIELIQMLENKTSMI